PEVFGNVLSQSGSFWWSPDRGTESGWLLREYAATPQRPLRFYLDAGQMETTLVGEAGSSILLSNRHLRDVLTAKGYKVKYQEFRGGHEPLNWRGTFADGLIALLGRDPLREP